MSRPASRTILAGLRRSQPSSSACLQQIRYKSASAKASSSVQSDDFVLPRVQLGPTHPSRYRGHYEDTLAEDLLYMTYDHNAVIAASSEAAASSSTPEISTIPTPYELNRPTPLPRGNRPTNPHYQNTDAVHIPELESIIIHTMVKEAIGNKPALLTAIMALRAISGETELGGGRAGSSGVQVLASKSGAAAFKLRAGMPVAVKVELKGDAMYTFIQCLVDFVLPRIRDFPGFPLSPPSASKQSPSATGGVVSMGLPASAMALFPQIEVNLDAYPRTHGFHMQFLTSAKGKGAQDKARALLSGFRIPFARR